MQYYRDGFRGGDPDLSDAAPCRRDYGLFAPLPEKVDVLIAGSGPAGLCLAAQLSQFPEIDVMVAERRPGPMEKGQADGVNTRTMEMFQAFGFAEKVKRESYWVNQTAFWTPDPADPARIRRAGRVQDVADDSSEMPHTLINQARIHELFMEVMRKAPRRTEVDYGWSVVDVTVDPEGGEHPVTAVLENTGVNAGTRAMVRAKYVVGCDGARSNVRRAIGGTLHGDAAHQAWGVMDILANTDFPDIRQKCLIASKSEGNVLILPREGGYLFRMYVELDKLNPDERVSAKNLTAQDIVAAAGRIMQPYTLDVKEVVWWSVYEIGHRMTDRFDDVPAGEDRDPRVFTAGDACHTHSPKAGQGMNVSMQDSFNLGWKLGHVFRGLAAPSILRSYSAERWLEAKRLVDTDHEWARIMSAPQSPEELAGTVEPRMQKQFVANLEFTGGLAVRYEPSALIAGDAHQALATGLPVGKRFHSAPVVRVADAMRMELGHAAEADGRWRIYAFAGAGDTGAPGGAIHGLAEWLEHDPASPILRHTPAGADIDAVIDLRAVFQPVFEGLDYAAMPALLTPLKGRLRLQDHEKAFCTDHKGAGDIFDLRGIDRAQGCMVVVRPDQYVAHILPLDGTAALADFFAGFLLPAARG